MASPNLGLLSLWASLKFVAALLIASSRSIGSSKMHSKAVIPTKGSGMNTGGAMYFRVPVAAAAVPAASGGAEELSPQWMLLSDFLS